MDEILYQHGREGGRRGDIIEVDGKQYEFHANVGVLHLIGLPANLVGRDNNRTACYMRLTKLGVGIIPELPAVDTTGLCRCIVKQRQSFVTIGFCQQFR